MKDYTILAKFLIPLDQTDEVLRDPLYSGIQYAGCYLLKDNRKELKDWYREHLDKPVSGLNRPCKYVLAFEDWGNVFLPDDATEVNESELDQCDGYWNYTHAILAFQSAVSEILMEMNTYEATTRVQEACEHYYEMERKHEAAEAHRKELEAVMADDPMPC